MKEFLRKMTAGTVLCGIAYTVCGVLLMIWPETTGQTICYVGASIILAMGLLGVISYVRRLSYPVEEMRGDLATGLILIAVAIFIYIRQEMIVSLIPTLLGFVIIVDGIIKLQYALDLKRLQFEGWFFVLILAFFSIAFGIVLMGEPFEAVRTMMMVLGVGLVFSGITNLITTLFVRKKVKQHKGGTITIEEKEND